MDRASVGAPDRGRAAGGEQFCAAQRCAVRSGYSAETGGLHVCVDRSGEWPTDSETALKAAGEELTARSRRTEDAAEESNRLSTSVFNDPVLMGSGLTRRPPTIRNSTRRCCGCRKRKRLSALVTPHWAKMCGRSSRRSARSTTRPTQRSSGRCGFKRCPGAGGCGGDRRRAPTEDLSICNRAARSCGNTNRHAVEGLPGNTTVRR